MLKPIQLLVPMVAVLIALPAGAQDKGTEKSQPVIPRSAIPPAGMCRIWLKDVAPAQQPAPTDCAAAIRARPQGAQVLFGGELKPGTSVDAGPDGRSRAAQPVNLWQLPSDYDQRQRELAKRAMFENTLKQSLQSGDRAVTAKVVTELPPKTPTTGPQTSVPTPSTKVP